MERILSHENLGFGMIYLKFKFNYCSMLLTCKRKTESIWLNLVFQFNHPHLKTVPTGTTC